MLKKLLCRLFGHKWNEYSLKSVYKNKFCNRCGYEELKGEKNVDKI